MQCAAYVTGIGIFLGMCSVKGMGGCCAGTGCRQTRGGITPEARPVPQRPSQQQQRVRHHTQPGAATAAWAGHKGVRRARALTAADVLVAEGKTTPLLRSARHVMPDQDTLLLWHAFVQGEQGELTCEACILHGRGGPGSSCGSRAQAAGSSSSSSLDAWPADPAAFPPSSYVDRDLERAAVARVCRGVHCHGAAWAAGGLRMRQHVCR